MGFGEVGILFFYLLKLNQAVLTAVAFHLVCTFSVSKTSLVKGDSIWRELREHEYLGLSVVV